MNGKVSSGMNAKEVFLIVVFLATGALLNFGYPVVAQAYGIPMGMEFIIIAYCLVVMLVVPLRLTEVIAIGFFAGILNIVADTSHLATVLSGHAPRSEMFMALFNLVSEPIGILVCFLTFAYLAEKMQQVAPFVAAFFATLGSGLMYLVMVYFLNPHLIAAQPAYIGAFTSRVLMAAVMNALLVQVIFMVVEKPVKSYLEGPDE